MDFKITRLRNLYKKYERFLIPGALLLGFLTDLLTFRLINFNFAVIALLGHLIFSGFSIIVINLYEDGLVKGKFFDFLRIVAPLIIQYTFGSLFSAFVIFYSQSGSIWASWPFISVLIFLMVANEVFRKYNTRPDIQMTVYFFALFSFANILIPFLLKKLGPFVFISSGFLSLIILFIIFRILYQFIPRVRRVKLNIILGVSIVFIAMNIFYFMNLIPPIPLALRDIGVYYDIERTGSGDYRVLSRKVGFFENLLLRNNFYYKNGEAYVFSSVFSPPGMSINISHEWQFKDESKKWQTKNLISFPVSGGRGSGYRGYSKTNQIIPGKWRVNIKTSSGQIIGRISFKAILTDEVKDFYYEIK